MPEWFSGQKIQTAFVNDQTSGRSSNPTSVPSEVLIPSPTRPHKLRELALEVRGAGSQNIQQPKKFDIRKNPLTGFYEVQHLPTDIPAPPLKRPAYFELG